MNKKPSSYARELQSLIRIGVFLGALIVAAALLWSGVLSALAVDDGLSCRTKAGMSGAMVALSVGLWGLVTVVRVICRRAVVLVDEMYEDAARDIRKSLSIKGPAEDHPFRGEAEGQDHEQQSAPHEIFCVRCYCRFIGTLK